MKATKWLLRAEEYERILSENGVEAAEAYLLRYLSRIDRMTEALAKLQELKRRQKDRPSEPLRTRRAFHKLRGRPEEDPDVVLQDAHVELWPGASST